MIPEHLINKAAQAILGNTGSTGRLEDMHPEDAAYMRADARAALEAVAAEIWQEGVNFALPGKETWAEAAHNPYKRNEHA